MRILKAITLSIFLFYGISVDAREFNIYVDADFSVHKDSGYSILKGVEYAIGKNKIEGHKFNVIKLDHRGNTRRSLANYKKVLKDPNALVVIGGLHSPPLITNNKFINDNQMLTLVPWAAGGPITRSKTKENWFFRLSVDDAQAGGFIASYAHKKFKCKMPYLLLEDTPWGKSNERNMSKGLKKFGLKPTKVNKFGWGIGNAQANEIAEDIKISSTDCIFFVGNGKDAKVLFNALGKAKVDKTIFSHWGITGGDNKAMAETILNAGLDVRVIQTKFSFLQKKLSKHQKGELDGVMKSNGFKSKKDISPMSGWVHSIDLMDVLFSALRNVSLDGDIKVVRSNVKNELENLKRPVQGLIKKYNRPFTKYSKTNPNAHEALRGSDFIMFKYQKDGSLN